MEDFKQLQNLELPFTFRLTILLKETNRQQQPIEKDQNLKIVSADFRHMVLASTLE